MKVIFPNNINPNAEFNEDRSVLHFLFITFSFRNSKQFTIHFRFLFTLFKVTNLIQNLQLISILDSILVVLLLKWNHYLNECIYSYAYLSENHLTRELSYNLSECRQFLYAYPMHPFTLTQLMSSIFPVKFLTYIFTLSYFI